jgi:hypothetical protein
MLARQTPCGFTVSRQIDYGKFFNHRILSASSELQKLTCGNFLMRLAISQNLSELSTMTFIVFSARAAFSERNALGPCPSFRRESGAKLDS